MDMGMLKGGMGKKELKAIAGELASIPEGTPRVILATGSYIGEGFDDSRLDALFLTMPISWRGTLQPYVGRLHRIHDGKKVVRVFDYVDSNVPMLARMYEKRLLGYRAIGYEASGHHEFSADAMHVYDKFYRYVRRKYTHKQVEQDDIESGMAVAEYCAKVVDPLASQLEASPQKRLEDGVLECLQEKRISSRVSA
jgi:superfamily II DNA or RNA helicase